MCGDLQGCGHEDLRDVAGGVEGDREADGVVEADDVGHGLAHGRGQLHRGHHARLGRPQLHLVELELSRGLVGERHLS